MRILLATAEAEPFAKTGGLGDVMGGLPIALAEQGNDVAVVMPKYSSIPHEYVEKMRYITSFFFPLGWRQVYCGVFELKFENYTVYFIDNEYYFKRDNMYGYADDVERFAFFSKAILEAMQEVGFKPDVINCNDWHVGMIPVLLDAYFKRSPFYEQVKTVMTIHNLKFQGRYNHEQVFELFSLGDYYFTDDKVEYKGDASYLKGGLVYADYITTVSESYAEEIKNEYFGEGLDGLLFARSNSLKGIVNGVNYDIYNPAKDPMIYKNYNGRNFVSGKLENKKSLLYNLGMPYYEGAPLIGVVSRLTEQKGFDLFEPIMDEIIAAGAQMIIVGTGDEKYENMFRHFAWKYPDKVCAYIKFSNEIAHKVYAASDMFLMPSKFEPCGLSQLISFKYGTVPIVREVGGLKDTVNPYNEFTGEGNGFSFANYNAHEMLYTVKRAIELYRDKKIWNPLIRAGMRADFSWDVSAKKHLEIYKMITGKE